MRTFSVTVKLADNQFETYQIKAETVVDSNQGVSFYSKDSTMVAFVPFDKLISVIDLSVSSKSNS